jgi:hypothetical protein
MGWEQVCPRYDVYRTGVHADESVTRGRWLTPPIPVSYVGPIEARCVISGSGKSPRGQFPFCQGWRRGFDGFDDFDDFDEGSTRMITLSKRGCGFGSLFSGPAMR